jgi:hypothetical protein
MFILANLGKSRDLIVAFKQPSGPERVFPHLANYADSR